MIITVFNGLAILIVNYSKEICTVLQSLLLCIMNERKVKTKYKKHPK